MNSYELETTVAAPIQKIGMSYYFDPQTAAHGSVHDLNMFEFYGIGRGGVLGDVSASTVADAFWFFHQRAIDGLWNPATAKVAPELGASEHLQAAYNYAERVFAELPEQTLRGFADATQKVLSAVPAGLYPLVDGYRNFPVPVESARAAYLGSILLRELRGGVHIDATREFSITPSEACFISNEMIFKLHGYKDEDAPERTTELESRMRQAEEMTTKVMAGFLDVLSDAERAAFAKGVEAMDVAIKKSTGG